MATRNFTCNSVSDRSSNNAAMMVAGDKFTASGDTSSIIGSVSQFTIKHFHTQTSNKTSAQWGLSATITFGNGDTITSDTQTYACGNSGREWTNTFTIAQADQEAVGTKLREYGITSVTINIATKPSNGGYLYWQATSSHPMKIDATFTAYSGRSPSITDWNISWATTRDLYQYQKIDFEFDLTLDALTGGDDPTVTLSIGSGGTSYTNCVFMSDPITGQITGGLFADVVVPASRNSFTLTVEDAAGNTGTLQNTFTAIAHTKPVIQTFNAERYLDNGGTVVISPLGTRVCLTITVNALWGGTDTIVLKNGTTTQNKGALSLEITDLGSGNSTWQTITNALSSTAAYSVTKDTTIDTDGQGVPITRYTGAAYSYRLIASDMFSSTETTVTVGSTSAIMNIEKNGVAIGKLCTQGSADNPIFDVAMETTFEAGVPVKLAGYDMNRASQYVEIEISDSTHFSKVYSWGGYPRITRVGPIVHLSGIIETNDSISKSGDNIVSRLAFIPDWAIPFSHVNCVQTGIDSGFIFNIGVEFDASTNEFMIIIRHPTATYTIPQALRIHLDCSWIAWDAYSGATGN